MDEFFYKDERSEIEAYSLKAFPMPGQTVGAAFENVTQRKNLEQQFLQAQKMEVVGRLAG